MAINGKCWVEHGCDAPDVFEIWDAGLATPGSLEPDGVATFKIAKRQISFDASDLKEIRDYIDEILDRVEEEESGEQEPTP